MTVLSCLGRVRWQKLSDEAKRKLLASGEIEPCEHSDSCPLCVGLCSELDTSTCNVAGEGDADDHE